MDLLQIYKDRNDDEIGKLEDQFQDPHSTASSPEASPPRLLPAKFAAPKVDETMLALMVAQAYQAQSRPIDPLQHVVAFNPTYEQLWAPIVGPAHPYTKDGIAQGIRNHKLGFVEDASIEPFIFDEQYYTFHKYGYAPDPSASAGNNYVGDLDALQKNDAISVYNIPQHEQKKRKIEKKETEKEGNGHEENLNKVELQNPASETWLMKNRKSPWAGKKEGLQTELTDG